MKIVKLITSHGGVGYSGKGGHYHSLSTIGEALDDPFKIEAFSFGQQPSQVLQDRRIYKDHIYIDKVTDLLSYNRHNELIDSIRSADVVHCYDKESLIQGAKLARHFNKPLAFTRCGGKNPLTYFPFVPNAVFFSKENLSYFKERRLTGDNAHVIQNRIKRVKSDQRRIELLKQRYSILDEPVVLHIARFSRQYQFSHLQAIDFAKHLRGRGVKCKLLLIGHDIDHDVTALIRESIEKDDHLITEPAFCRNANELIDVADYVVGQGRVIMEAAQFGKQLYVTTLNHDLPVLVTDRNIETFLYYNMTGRAVDDDMINSVQEEGIDGKQLFDTFFSIDNLSEKYEGFYHNCVTNKNKLRRRDELLMSLNKSLKMIR